MSNQNIRGTLFPRLLLVGAIVTFLVPWCTLIGDGGVNAHPFVSRVTAYPTSWKSRTKRTTSTAVASTLSKELSTSDLVTNTPDFYTPGAVSYNYVPPFHPAPVYVPFPSGFFPYQPIPPPELTHSPHLIKVKRKKKRRLQLSDTSGEAAIKAEEGRRSETDVFSMQTQQPQLVTVPPQPIMYTDLVPEGSRYEPLYGLPDVTVPQPGLSEIPPGFTRSYPIYQNPIIATSRAGIPSPVFDLVIEDAGDVNPKRKTRPRRLTRRRKVKNQYFQPQGSLPNTETEPGSLLSSIIPIDTFPGGGSEGDSNKYYPSLEPIATASKEEQRSNNPNFWTVSRAEQEGTTPRRRLRGKKRDRLIITASNSSETGNSTVSNVKAATQEPDAEVQENEDDLHSSESFNPFLNASVPFSNDLGTSINHNLDLLHPLFNSDTALKDLSKIPENKTIGIKHKLSDQVLGVKFAPDLHMDFDSKPHHLLNHDSIISSDYERQLYKSRPRIEVKHSVSVSTSSTISSSSSSLNKKQQHKSLSTTPMPSISMRDPYTPLLSSHSSSSSSTSSSSGPSRSHEPVEVTSSFSLHQNFFYTTTTPRPASRDTTLKPQTTINFPITSFTTTDTSTTTGSTVTTYKPTLSPEMMETIKAGSSTTEQPRPVYILSKVTPPAWTTAGIDSSTTFKTPFTLRPKVSTLQPVPTRSYTVLSRKPLPTTLRMMTTTTTPRPTTTTTLRTTSSRPTTTTTRLTTPRPTSTTTYRTTTPSTPRTTRKVPTWLTSSTTPSTTTTTTMRTTSKPRTTTTVRHQINTFLDVIDVNSGKNTWTPGAKKSTTTTPRPKPAEKIQINKDPPLILMPPFTTDTDIPPITLTTPDPATRPPSTQIANETLLLQQLFGIVNEELGITTPKPTIITTKTTSTRAPTTTKITTTATTKKRTTTTPKPSARTTTAPPTAQEDLLNLLNLLGGNNNNGGGSLGTSNSNNAGGLFGSSTNSGLSGLLGGSNSGSGLFGSNSNSNGGGLGALLGSNGNSNGGGLGALLGSNGNNNGGGLGALLGSNGNSNGGGLGALLGSNGNNNGGGLFGSGGLFGGGQSSGLFGGSGGGLFGQNNNGGGLFGGGLLSGLGQATTRRPTTAASNSNELFGLLNLLQPTTPPPTTANSNLFNLFNLFGPQTTTTPAPGLGNLLGLFNIFTPAPPVLATTRRPATVKTTPPANDILSLLNILNPTSAPKKQSSGSSKDVKKDAAQSELDALVQQALLESLGGKSGPGVGQASNVNQQQLPASSSKGLSDADLKSIYDLIDQQGATATTKRPTTITTPFPSSSKTTTLMPIFRNMLNLFGITDPSPSTTRSTTSIPKTTKSSPSTTTAAVDSTNSSPIPVYNPNSTSQKPKALGTDDLILQILEAEALEKAKKSETLNSSNSTTKSPTPSPAITGTTAEGNLDLLSQLLNLGQAVQPEKSTPVRSNNNKEFDELKLLHQQLLQQEQQEQQQKLLQQQKQQQEQQQKLLQQQKQQQQQQQQSLFQQQQPGAFDIQSLLSQGLLNSATTVRPDIAPSESNIFHILANSFTPRPTNKPNGLYYWVDLNAFMGDAAADPNSGIRPKLGHKDYFIKVKRETSGETTAEPTSLTDSVYFIY